MDEYFIDLLFQRPKTPVVTVKEGRWDRVWRALAFYGRNLSLLWDNLQLNTYVFYHVLVIATVGLLGLVFGIVVARTRNNGRKNFKIARSRAKRTPFHKTTGMGDSQPDNFIEHMKKYLSKETKKKLTETAHSYQLSNDDHCLLGWDKVLKCYSDSKNREKTCQCGNEALAKARILSSIKDNKQDACMDTVKGAKTKSAIRIDEFGDVTCLAAKTTDKKKSQTKDECLDQKKKFKNPNLMVSLHSPPIQDAAHRSSESETSISKLASSSSGHEIKKKSPRRMQNKNEQDEWHKPSPKQNLRLQQSFVPNSKEGVPATWTTDAKRQQFMAGGDLSASLQDCSDATFGSGQLASFITEVCDGEHFDRGEVENKEKYHSRADVREKKCTPVEPKEGIKGELKSDIYNPKYFASAIGKANVEGKTRKGEKKEMKQDHAEITASVRNNTEVFQDASPLSTQKAFKNKPISATEQRFANASASKVPSRCMKKPPRFVFNQQGNDATEDAKKKQTSNRALIGNNSLTRQRVLKKQKNQDPKCLTPRASKCKRENLKFVKRSELKSFYKDLHDLGEANQSASPKISQIDNALDSNNERYKMDICMRKNKKLDRPSMYDDGHETDKRTPQNVKTDVSKTTQTDLVLSDALVYRFKPSDYAIEQMQASNFSELYASSENLSDSPKQLCSPCSTYHVSRSTFCLGIGQSNNKTLLNKRHAMGRKMNDRFLDKRIRELNSYTDSFDQISSSSVSSHRLLSQTAKTQLVSSQKMVQRTSPKPIATQIVPHYEHVRPKQILNKQSPTHTLSSPIVPMKQVSADHTSEAHRLFQNEIKKDFGNAISESNKSAGKANCTNSGEHTRSSFSSHRYERNNIGSQKHRFRGMSSINTSTDREPQAKIKRSNECIPPSNQYERSRKHIPQRMIANNLQNDSWLESNPDNIFQIPIVTEKNYTSGQETSRDQSQPYRNSYTAEAMPLAGVAKMTSKDTGNSILSRKDTLDFSPKQKRVTKTKTLFSKPKRNDRERRFCDNTHIGTVSDRVCDLQMNITAIEDPNKKSQRVASHLPVKNEIKGVPFKVNSRLEAKSNLKHGKRKLVNDNLQLKSSQQNKVSSDKARSSKLIQSPCKQVEPKSPISNKAVLSNKALVSRLNHGKHDAISKSDRGKKLMNLKEKSGKVPGKQENDSQARSPSTYHMLHKNRSTSKRTSLLPPKSTRENEKNNITPKDGKTTLNPAPSIPQNKLSQAPKLKVGSKKADCSLEITSNPKKMTLARRILKGRRMRVVKGGNTAMGAPSVQASNTSRDMDTNSRWSDIIPADTASSNGGSHKRGTLDELLVLNKISYSSVTSVDSKKIFQSQHDDDNETEHTLPPKDHDLENNRNNLGSILSNLAYIEDLNSEEIEKLSLPQHIPDLIATSSGESVGPNGVFSSSRTKRNSKSGSCHSRERSTSKRPVDGLLSSKQFVFDNIREKDNASKNKEMRVDVTLPGKEHNNGFNNLFFIESLDIPSNAENVTGIGANEIEDSKARSDFSQNEVVNKENNHEGRKQLFNRWAYQKLNKSDSKLCSNASNQKLIKRCSTLCGSMSCSHNNLITDKSNEKACSRFQTPNFQNIFSSKETLRNWAKLNNIKPSLDNKVSQNYNHGYIKKVFQKEIDTPLMSQKNKVFNKTSSDKKKKTHPSGKNAESKNEPRVDDMLSELNVQVPSASSKYSTYAESENLSWDVCRNIPKLKNKSSDKHTYATREDKNIAKKQTSKLERNTSSSDVAITWLGEKKSDSLLRSNVQKEALSNFANLDGSKRCNWKSSKTCNRSAAVLGASPTSLNKHRSADRPYCETSRSHVSFNSRERNNNVFLSMERIRTLQMKDLTGRSDVKGSRMTSPPKQSRYVKSALSYSQKKRTPGESSAVKCPETYCIEHNQDLELLPLVTNNNSPTIGDDVNEPNIQLAEVTKNNNKLPISYTSLYYTTQIDAVESDSSKSELQPPFCRYENNSYDMVNWDNTSDDVSTAELCSTWVSGTADIARTPADTTDSSFNSVHHNRTKSFILDWYRPNPRHTSIARTMTTTESDVTFESDLDEQDELDSDIQLSHCIANKESDDLRDGSQPQISMQGASNPPLSSKRQESSWANSTWDNWSTPSWCAMYHTNLNITANQRSLMSGDKGISRTGNPINMSLKSKAEFCRCQAMGSSLSEKTTSEANNSFDAAMNVSDNEKFSTTCNPSYSCTHFQNAVQNEKRCNHQNTDIYTSMQHLPPPNWRANYLLHHWRKVEASQKRYIFPSLETFSAYNTQSYPCASIGNMLSNLNSGGKGSISCSLSMDGESSSFCTCNTSNFDAHNTQNFYIE